MRGIRRGLGAGKLVGDAWSRKQRGLEYLGGGGPENWRCTRGWKNACGPRGVEGGAGKWAEMSGRETPKALSVV